MKPLLIKKGRIIDPGQGLDETSSLLIRDGKIAALGRNSVSPPPADADVIDATGFIVCPGFIDLHCHLRDPGFEEKETIATGTRAAARGGFTTICCMPNTSPPLDNPAMISYVKSKAAGEGVVRVLPVGCISRGRQGEGLVDMEGLAAAGVIGYSDDGSPVMNAFLMRQALVWGRCLGLPVIDHCEDTVLSAGGQINQGEVSAKLGLQGIPASAEEVMVARDIALARLTRGWLHLAHISTAGSVALVRRAKEDGIRVTAEVTVHHLTLTEKEVETSGVSAKVNPPLRTEIDVQALIWGLKENVINVIVTDHAPHTEADKIGAFEDAAFGISGFETALASLMGLAHHRQLSLPMLIAKLTSLPAAMLGPRFGRLGTLEVGAPADITIFDPEREWVVDTGEFASKGRNTPLAGKTLKGRVMATIAGGKPVYRDSSVTIVAQISG